MKITTQNQIQSFETTKLSSLILRTRVAHFLSSNGPATRSEIAQSLGLKDSSVCARLNELMKEGRIATCGSKFDESTKRNVTLYCVSKN